MHIKEVPAHAKNFSAGRKQYRPEAVVIHIMEGTLTGTDSWFQNPASRVSAHYGIGKTGEVHRYVKETDTAYHAGRVNNPSWKGIKQAGTNVYVNPNYYTVGIEHEGNQHSEWTEAMYNASAEMIRDICKRWNIPVDRNHIVGHHEIYSVKTCPGHKVDLARLVAMAAGQPVAFVANAHTKMKEFGKVTTLTKLNIRKAPAKSAQAVSLVDAGIQLAYDGYVDDGDDVNGNKRWYYTEEGNWFWSGGVKK